MEEPGGQGVFASVCFHIVASDNLPVKTAEELRSILVSNGASEQQTPSSNGLCSLEGLTHIIAEHVDFEGYAAAEERMIPVVNCSWIETSIKKKKPQNPKSYSPDPRLFFSGLVIHPVGLPAGDTDAIIGGVLAMGGLYSGTLTRLVTHIIAMDLNNASCETARDRGLGCRVVLPHWIDDCLRLGKCIDEQPYLHPNPESLSPDATGPASGTSRPDLNGATSAHVERRLACSNPLGGRTDALSVLQSKRVFLSSDLAVSDHLRSTLDAMITNAGGTVAESVQRCNVLVCQHRQGAHYVQAYESDKTIGSLSWLYWMISRNTWTPPIKRLLHYPTSVGGLPGFEEFRICLSNYSGEARSYLENLAKAAGCEFTKTMKTDNTHLITAHTVSEKCEAAKEWGITTINHLWLEESYAKWKVQDATNPRYTTFPTRTNLTDVVGRTPIDKDALDVQFRSKNPVRAETPTDDGSDLDLDDVPGGPRPNSNLASPKGAPLKNFYQQPRLDGSDQTTEFTTPAPKKSRNVNKENETPDRMPVGSRSAKTQAAAKLHDLASDIALYEKEKKRRGGVLFGGRRGSNEVIGSGDRKRSSPVEEDAEYPQKKAKNSKEPLRLRMLMTGVSKYDGHDKSSIKFRDRLRDLGILITESENNCKYLIAPRIVRTKKFVCAIAQAPILVNPEFLDHCLEEDEVLDPEDFPFEDREGEEHYNIKTGTILDRARVNQGRLLKGCGIWVTKYVHGGFGVYESIIKMNGGKCLLFEARAGVIPKCGYDSDDEDQKPEPAYLVCGEDDSILAATFEEMSREAGREPHVVKTDWVLDAALKQEIGDPEEYQHENWS